jgi:hypothetical protein
VQCFFSSFRGCAVPICRRPLQPPGGQLGRLDRESRGKTAREQRLGDVSPAPERRTPPAHASGSPSPAVAVEKSALPARRAKSADGRAATLPAAAGDFGRPRSSRAASRRKHPPFRPARTLRKRFGFITEMRAPRHAAGFGSSAVPRALFSHRRRVPPASSWPRRPFA